MTEWENVVRRELRDYCEANEKRNLSLVEVHETVLPALKDEFPDATAYSNHLHSTLENLDDTGDIEISPEGVYRVNAADISLSKESKEPDSEPTGAGIPEDDKDVVNDAGEDGISGAPSSKRKSSLETKSLYDLLRSCQMGEAGAIVGGHIDRNDLRKELYIDTEEDELLSDFFVDEYERDGKHLIITGSAGDGKSALLSRAFNRAKNAGIPIEQNHIHMDATASDGKHQTYDETLSDFLQSVSENISSGKGPRTGLAMNLGLAIDFFERQGFRSQFDDLWDAIDSARNKVHHETESIVVLNLSHRSTYSSSPDNLGRGLLADLVEKFAFDSQESPFHHAFEKGNERCPSPEKCPLHYNARQFTDPAFREQIVELIAASGLINNIYLNPREILDIISKMIVPEPMQTVSNTSSGCPVGNSLQHGKIFDEDVIIWNSVFQRLSEQENDTRGYLDPAAQAEKDTDQEILSWSAGPGGLDEIIGDVPVLGDKDVQKRARTALRKQYFANTSKLETARDWSWFTEFAGALTFFAPADDHAAEIHRKYASKSVETVTNALRGWSGQAERTEDWVEFVDGVQGEYRFLSKWEKPKPNIEASREETEEETIPGQLWVVLQPGNQDLEIPVPVTFELYLLMKRISRGYRPNSRDLERSEGIRLIHSRLSEFTDKEETVKVVDKSDQQILRLERDAFGTIQLERGGAD